MIIFSPGPANISERVRRSLTLPDICHRDTEFAKLLVDVRNMILKICQVGNDYRSIVFSGSGTLAIESVIASLGGYNKKILIISNGVYGERAADIARHYQINIEEIRLPWGILPDLNRINDKLKEDKIGAIYIVHHETTAGLLNPLAQISGIAKKYQKMVLVDGISSIAGEVLDIDAWGIDAIAGSANKCIRGVAGIAFTVVSKNFLKTIEKCKSRSYYADLLRHLKAEDNGQPLFTPPIQVFYAFREALKELLDEGVQERINYYKIISKVLRNGLKKLKLKFYIAQHLMSNTMTAVYIPLGYDYRTLHRACKEKGYVIYGSQGKLARNIFRLGTVGLISHKDILGFLKVFGKILKKK